MVARVGLSWFPAGIAPRSRLLVLLSHWKKGGGAAVSRTALRGLPQDRKYVANFDGHFLSRFLPAEGRVVEFGHWPGGAAICQLQFPVERLRQVLER